VSVNSRMDDGLTVCGDDAEIVVGFGDADCDFRVRFTLDAAEILPTPPSVLDLDDVVLGDDDPVDVEENGHGSPCLVDLDHENAVYPLPSDVDFVAIVFCQPSLTG
jgi:hypothetical protein